MKVVHSLKLDVKKTNVQKIIEANQSEGLDRKLVITLVSGNKTLYLDSDEQSASIIGTKPDGTHIVGETRIKDGKVIYYIKPSTVSAVGDVDCQVKVVSDGVTYSAKFTIQVAEPLYTDEDIESTDEFSELVRLTQKAEKQVTVFRDEGEPDTDPETYKDIKEFDFYYDETNKVYYYATSVTTTITWKRIYNKDEVDALLDLKADKSTTYTKTEVDTLISPKANIWEGTDAPYTRINIGTTYEGIKEGDIYLYQVENDIPVFCKVETVDNVRNIFFAKEISEVIVKTTNPPSTYGAINYVGIANGTMWLNTTTKRFYVKVGESGTPPDINFHWQDLTGNRVWFGDDNPDDDTALGKLDITDHPMVKGDMYVRNYGTNIRTNEYLCINTDSTYAYLKKINGCYFSNNQPPAKGIDDVATANLNWKDWEEVFSEGTVYIYRTQTPGGYENTFSILKNVKVTNYNGFTTVKYEWDSLTYLSESTFNDFLRDEYYPETDALYEGKADKSTTYTKTEVDTELAKKQNTIDSTHKLNADNVDDTNSTNKFTNATEKAAWNAKQDAISAGDGIDISNDEIGVKLYNSQDNGLMFNSDGALALFKSVLARDSSFRGYLADTSTQNPLQPKLTAGKNISIGSDGKTISAVTPNFRLIKTITLTESNTSVVINEDEEGNAFECSEVLLSCSNILGTDNANLYIYASDGVNNRGTLLPNPISSTSAKIITSKIISDTTMAQLLVNLYDSGGYYTNVSRMNSYKLLDSLNHIQQVVISSNHPFTSGTFKLYGR